MPLRLSDLPASVAHKLGLRVTIKRSKYGAVKQTVDGEVFDSAKEARRYGELVIRQRVGEIENVQRQPQYLITRDGVVLASYRADFRYQLRATRAWVVEDVKGGQATRTEAYRLRKVFVEAQHGIQIQEIG